MALAGHPIICPAELHGGEDNTPSIGLTVDGAFLKERLADQPKPSEAPSRTVDPPRGDGER
jgi:hypothetical protein